MLFVGLNTISAQNQKQHYRVFSTSGENTLAVEKSISKAYLDSLRFLNQRRQIQVLGTNTVVELFSAQELMDTYQKQIAPNTIMDPSKARKVKFKLNSNYDMIVVSSNDSQK